MSSTRVGGGGAGGRGRPAGLAESRDTAPRRPFWRAVRWPAGFPRQPRRAAREGGGHGREGSDAAQVRSRRPEAGQRAGRPPSGQHSALRRFLSRPQPLSGASPRAAEPSPARRPGGASSRLLFSLLGPVSEPPRCRGPSHPFASTR